MKPNCLISFKFSHFFVLVQVSFQSKAAAAAAVDSSSPPTTTTATRAPTLNSIGPNTTNGSGHQSTTDITDRTELNRTRKNNSSKKTGRRRRRVTKSVREGGTWERGKCPRGLPRIPKLEGGRKFFSCLCPITSTMKCHL